MNTSEWLKRIDNSYASGSPFVCYAAPESNVITTYFQQDAKLHTTTDLSEEGFHMAPFLFHGTSYFFPRESCELVQTEGLEAKPLLAAIAIDATSEEQKKYEHLVAKAIGQIEAGRADKIVVSRKKEVVLKQFSIGSLLTQLFTAYPSAFTYLWFHPETGIWCGASPEVLLKTNTSSFSTMSLAGTRVRDAQQRPQWHEKELHEQQIVTDAIRSSLQELSADVKISKTTNHNAGHLVHLRTDITGVLKEGRAGINAVVGALHPTPAVCGRPKKLAASFITSHEGYDREFYTGFVGLVGKQRTSFYVNLRCMKIFAKHARVYVGGGITKSSVPKAEWEETQNKLQTMLRVLKSML